ncbi:hypothetical protein ABIE49_002594 [Bradyrhizobium sp. OAE829]
MLIELRLTEIKILIFLISFEQTGQRAAALHPFARISRATADELGACRWVSRPARGCSQSHFCTRCLWICVIAPSLLTAVPLLDELMQWMSPQRSAQRWLSFRLIGGRRGVRERVPEDGRGVREKEPRGLLAGCQRRTWDDVEARKKGRSCSRCDKKFARPGLTKATCALSRLSSGGFKSRPPMTSPIRITGCNAFHPMLLRA